MTNIAKPGAGLALDNALLSDIATSVALREGPFGVARFFRAVLHHEGATLRTLAQEVGLPIPVASAIRRELEKRGYLSRGGGVHLTDKGRAFATDVLNLSVTPPAHSVTAGDVGAPDPALVRRLQDLLADAPHIRVELDQAPCTPETALRRAALMHRAGALEGRSNLLLGDDDSLSLAIPLYLAHLGRVSPVGNITVLELDPGRIAFLREKTAQIGAEVSIIPHDLRDPLPAELKGRFDVFQTDPPYTIEGARLFLTRAAEALRPGPGSLGFLSYAQRAAADQIVLQRVIQALGFSVSTIWRGFNCYEGASILGSIGQMIELEGLFVDAPGQPQRYCGALYTADLSSRPRGYRCRSCGRRLILGERGAPSTIEALKSSGCPSCGEKAFSRWKPGGSRRKRR